MEDVLGNGPGIAKPPGGKRAREAVGIKPCLEVPRAELVRGRIEFDVEPFTRECFFCLGLAGVYFIDAAGGDELNTEAGNHGGVKRSCRVGAHSVEAASGVRGRVHGPAGVGIVVRRRELILILPKGRWGAPFAAVRAALR